jgi:hypothetical protein
MTRHHHIEPHQPLSLFCHHLISQAESVITTVSRPLLSSLGCLSCSRSPYFSHAIHLVAPLNLPVPSTWIRYSTIHVQQTWQTSFNWPFPRTWVSIGQRILGQFTISSWQATISWWYCTHLYCDAALIFVGWSNERARWPCSSLEEWLSTAQDKHKEDGVAISMLRAKVAESRFVPAPILLFSTIRIDSTLGVVLWGCKLACREQHHHSHPNTCCLFHPSLHLPITVIEGPHPIPIPVSF